MNKWTSFWIKTVKKDLIRFELKWIKRKWNPTFKLFRRMTTEIHWKNDIRIKPFLASGISCSCTWSGGPDIREGRWYLCWLRPCFPIQLPPTSVGILCPCTRPERYNPWYLCGCRWGRRCSCRWPHHWRRTLQKHIKCKLEYICKI